MAGTWLLSVLANFILQKCYLANKETEDRGVKNFLKLQLVVEQDWNSGNQVPDYRGLISSS